LRIAQPADGRLTRFDLNDFFAASRRTAFKASALIAVNSFRDMVRLDRHKRNLQPQGKGNEVKKPGYM